MKANRVNRKKVNSVSYENMSQSPTLLDYYQGLMRKVWMLIGINPDRVHGLDEFFTMLTLCTYFITFFSLMYFQYTKYVGSFANSDKYQQYKINVVPQYTHQLKKMLCPDAAQVNAPVKYSFLNAQYESESENVVFQSNVPMIDISQFYDYLIIFPRQITPFSKQGYRVIAGAVNAISCPPEYQNEDPEALIKRLEQQKSKILFGFGETAAQIITAAKQNFEFAHENVIQILASKGASNLVIPHKQSIYQMKNEYRLGRSLLQGSMTEFYNYGSFIGNLIKKVKSKSQSEQYSSYNDEIFTLTMMNDQDGDVVKIPTHLQNLKHSEAVEARLMELQHHIYLQLQQLISEINNLNNQGIQLKTNKKSGIESVLPVYGRITVSRPIMLLLTYVLTLLLAANINIHHRRFRMDFLKYLIQNYIMQTKIYAFAIIIQSSCVISLYIILDKTPLTFNTDNDLFFRMSGISVCLAILIVNRISNDEFHQINPDLSHKQLNSLSKHIRRQQTNTSFRFQYSIAVQLINLYICILGGSNLGIIRLILVVINFFGLYVVEFLQSRHIIRRPWVINAVFSLTSTFIQIGYLYTQVLSTQNSIDCQQKDIIQLLIGQILLNCHFLTLILQQTRYIFQLCKGKFLVTISVILTFLFYLSQSYKDISQIELTAGFKASQKMMPTPRINHRALLLCDSKSLSCDVWLGSKMHKTILYVEKQLQKEEDGTQEHKTMHFTMYDNMISISIKPYTDEQYKIAVNNGKIQILSTSEGEYRAMRPIIDSVFTFNYDIRIFMK